MSWLGKGRFIGTDRDTNVNRDINNAYGVWSVTAVKDYVQNYRWMFPATAIAATGGSISTISVGSTPYRVHQFDSTGTFTILSGSSEVFTIECVGGPGITGNPAPYGVSNPGCGGGGINYGGAGGGANVVVATDIQLTSGIYTINVGDSSNGSSVVSPFSGVLIKSSNGGTGGNATGSPGTGLNGSPGSGGIAGTSFVSSGFAITSYSGGSGGAGGLSYSCDTNLNYRGSNGGNPGYTLLIPLVPSIPSQFSVYKNVVGPLIPTTSNRGLGEVSGGAISPAPQPAPYGPGPDSNFSPTGGSRGGIVRIIYKFIQ